MSEREVTIEELRAFADANGLADIDDISLAQRIAAGAPTSARGDKLLASYFPELRSNDR